MHCDGCARAIETIFAMESGVRLLLHKLSKMQAMGFRARRASSPSHEWLAPAVLAGSKVFSSAFLASLKQKSIWPAKRRQSKA